MSLAKMIGISHEEMDCWKLCQYFYSEILKRELPDLYTTPPKNEACISVASETEKNFIKIEKPEFGDIVLMNIGGYPSHVGIYLGEGKILQTFQKTGSAIHPMSKWVKSIIGFYRWPN
jgi:cell wall-associated NlpC family hydrolase